MHFLPAKRLQKPVCEWLVGKQLRIRARYRSQGIGEHPVVHRKQEQSADFQTSANDQKAPEKIQAKLPEELLLDLWNHQHPGRPVINPFCIIQGVPVKITEELPLLGTLNAKSLYLSPSLHRGMEPGGKFLVIFSVLIIERAFPAAQDASHPESQRDRRRGKQGQPPLNGKEKEQAHQKRGEGYEVINCLVSCEFLDLRRVILQTHLHIPYALRAIALKRPCKKSVPDLRLGTVECRIYQGIVKIVSYVLDQSACGKNAKVSACHDQHGSKLPAQDHLIHKELIEQRSHKHQRTRNDTENKITDKKALYSPGKRHQSPHHLHTVSHPVNHHPPPFPRQTASERPRFPVPFSPESPARGSCRFPGLPPLYRALPSFVCGQ